MGQINGDGFTCSLAEECKEHHLEVKEMVKKVNEVYYTINHISKYTSYLVKLDTMAQALVAIQENLSVIRTSLLPAALSTDRIPIKTIDEIVAGQGKGTLLIGKILGVVIIVLLFVIAHLLIGENLGWIKTLL